MQKPSRKLQNEKMKMQHSNRVVDMRTWKAKKKWQGVRGKRTALTLSLLALVGLFAVIAAGLAIVSWIPFSGQIQGIIYTWLFAAIGSVMSLVLLLLGERSARKFLISFIATMAISLLAAAMRLVFHA